MRIAEWFDRNMRDTNAMGFSNQFAGDTTTAWNGATDMQHNANDFELQSIHYIFCDRLSIAWQCGKRGGYANDKRDLCQSVMPYTYTGQLLPSFQ